MNKIEHIIKLLIISASHMSATILTAEKVPLVEINLAKICERRDLDDFDCFCIECDSPWDKLDH